MKPWTNAQTVAVLWTLVAVLLVLLVAGWVSEYEAQLQWSQESPAYVAPPPASVCHGPAKGAWCP